VAGACSLPAETTFSATKSINFSLVALLGTGVDRFRYEIHGRRWQPRQRETEQHYWDRVG